MAKSRQTFGKKEKEKKRLKKREEKQQKKEERKANSQGGDFDAMIAYVDEYGNISDTPPDPDLKKEEIDVDSISIGVPKMEDQETIVYKGKVVFFNDAKGFGFIKEQKTQEKYFVHVNGLLEEVYENDSVIFELEKGMKGMNAVKVKKFN